MSDLVELVQTLQMAAKSVVMYTAAHPRAQAATENLVHCLDGWLAEKPRLHLAASGGKLFVDGLPFEAQNLHVAATARMLTERQISGLVFSRGITAEELRELLGLLILKPAKIEERGGVGRIMADLALPHVDLGQIQYREVREGEGGPNEAGALALHPSTVPLDTLAAEAPAAGPAPAAATDPLQALAAQWRMEFLKLQGGSGDRPGQGGRGDGPGGLEASSGPGGEGLGLGTPGAGPAGDGGFDGTGPGLGAPGAGSGRDGCFDGTGPGLGAPGAGPARDGAFGAGELGSGGADLSGLGQSLVALGLGEGFPADAQMEALHQVLLGLPAGQIMGVLAGLESLPHRPAGLRLAFQALAAQAFAWAGANLMADPRGQGPGWEVVKERLHEAMNGSGQGPALLAALETELRRRGLDLGHLQELVARLDWDRRNLDEQLQLVEERDHLWRLSHDQRLQFLRRLLEEGRFEAFTAILEQILRLLTAEDARHRQLAVRTLAGVAPWIASPGLPPDCEGPFLQGLAAHFGWEPVAAIHRTGTEALGLAVTALVLHGEPGRGQAVLQELDGLCAFLENREPWRSDALAWLWDRMGQPAAMDKVLELLHTANPESLLIELIPYLERVGLPAAQRLVEVLGEEQDRKRRSRLVEVIRGLGGLATPAVEASLDSPKWYLVRNTLNILADLGDLQALKPAEACLAHPDGRVRRAAVRTVWKLGGPDAMPALVAAFPGADPDTMLEIMFAFGQIRASEAVPLLAQAAADRRLSDKLRARAAETLGLVGDGRAQPYLEELVRRKGRIFTTAEPTEIRVAACRGLAALGTPQALAALRALVAREPRNADRPLLQQVLEQDGR